MKTAYFRRLVVPAFTLFLVVLSLFIAQLAFGQTAASGTIVGTVTDSTGALVGGATITILDPATKNVRTTLSNKQGQYVVPNVPPGVYEIKTVKEGFQTDEISALTVSGGSQTTANFKLAVGRVVELPRPLEGRHLHLGDIIAYQLDALQSLTRSAANDRVQFLSDFYTISDHAVHPAAGPYAYVISPEQVDPA